MFQYPQFIKPILGIDTDNAINYNTKISINNNIKKNNFKYINIMLVGLILLNKYYLEKNKNKIELIRQFFFTIEQEGITGIYKLNYMNKLFKFSGRNGFHHDIIYNLIKIKKLFNDI